MSEDPGVQGQDAHPIRLAEGSLVVLVGPPASGKTSWAMEEFPPDQVVSSDQLRAVVGEGGHGPGAGKGGFGGLGVVVGRRLRGRLAAGIDSLGTDGKRRRAGVAAAGRAGVPAVAVVFDVEPTECRK